MNLCFAKCEKLSFVLGGFFLAMFWLFFSKNTIKIGILAHFSKQTITKKMAFLEVIIWSKLEVIILVQVDCVLKNANLDQIITSNFFARNFIFQKKRAETPIFIVFFGNRCFRKNKLGPDNNFQKGQTWTR